MIKSIEKLVFNIYYAYLKAKGWVGGKYFLYIALLLNYMESLLQ